MNTVGVNHRSGRMATKRGRVLLTAFKFAALGLTATSIGLELATTPVLLKIRAFQIAFGLLAVTSLFIIAQYVISRIRSSIKLDRQLREYSSGSTILRRSDAVKSLGGAGGGPVFIENNTAPITIINLDKPYRGLNRHGSGTRVLDPGHSGQNYGHGGQMKTHTNPKRWDGMGRGLETLETTAHIAKLAANRGLF